MQHGQLGLVVSTLHVHLDEQRVSDHLVATRGVKHGKLVFTTTGERLRSSVH